MITSFKFDEKPYLRVSRQTKQSMPDGYYAFRSSTFVFAGGLVNLQANKFTYVSLISQKGASGCVRDDLWLNSNWILDGVVDSCAYRKIANTKIDCPPFIGMMGNILKSVSSFL